MTRACAAVWLGSVAAACAVGRPDLSPEDSVRFAAVAEAAIASGPADLCVAVVVEEPSGRADDPRGPLAVALARLGDVHAESRCPVASRRAPSQPPFHVVLGPVSMKASRDGGYIRVHRWQQDATNEQRRQTFGRRDAGWELLRDELISEY